MSNYAASIIVVYACCGLKANMQFSVERANSCVFVIFFFFVHLSAFLYKWAISWIRWVKESKQWVRVIREYWNLTNSSPENTVSFTGYNINTTGHILKAYEMFSFHATLAKSWKCKKPRSFWNGVSGIFCQRNRLVIAMLSFSKSFVSNYLLSTLRRKQAFSNSLLSHGGHIVPGDQKSFVLPRRASPPRFWLRGSAW